MGKLQNIGMPFNLGNSNGKWKYDDDGPTVNITNLDETEANKALAVSIIEDVLMGQNPIISPIISLKITSSIIQALIMVWQGIQDAVDYLIP
jgi:hypothetical protein